MSLAQSILKYLKADNDESFFRLYVIRPIREALEEFLQFDQPFFLSYFPRYFHLPPTSLTTAQLASGFLAVLRKEANGSESTGEADAEDSVAVYIAASWIEQTMSIYRKVEAILQETYGPAFEQLEQIEGEVSARLTEECISSFGPIQTFCFVILGSVRLEQSAFDSLFARATEEHHNSTNVEIELQKSQHNLENSESVRDLLAENDDYDNNDGDEDEYGMNGRSLMISRSAEFPRFSRLKLLRRNTISPSREKLQPKGHSGYLELQKTSAVRYHSPGKPTTTTVATPNQEDKTEWKRKWVVVKDGKLLYYPQSESLEPSGCIPLYLISTVRTEPKFGPTCFLLNAHSSNTFVFRASDQESMMHWLWTIQSWLATMLATMLAPKHRQDVSRILETPRWWKRLDTPVLGTPGQLDDVQKFAVLKKSIDCREDDDVVACVGYTTGRKSSMEDRHYMGADCFAVFDGHAGSECSEFCANHFGASHLDRGSPEEVEASLRRVFASMEAGFRAVALDPLLEEPLYCGSTAIALFLLPSHFVVANVGDSRAVLCRGVVAIPLSHDHTPQREDERRRVEATGAHIVEKQVLDIPHLYRLNPQLMHREEIPRSLGENVGFVTVLRIMGELQVSRAIGDFDFKGTLASEIWDMELAGDIVDATPELTRTARNANADRFIIVACDGLWDVFSNQEAVDFVSKGMQTYFPPLAPLTRSDEVEAQNSAQELSRLALSVSAPNIFDPTTRAVSEKERKKLACERIVEDLVQEALRRGSMDNITATLIML